MEGKAMMVPITVRFPEGMARAIEALRIERADQPDKGQVIRELVAKGLEAMQGEPKTRRR